MFQAYDFSSVALLLIDQTAIYYFRDDTWIFYEQALLKIKIYTRDGPDLPKHCKLSDSCRLAIESAVLLTNPFLRKVLS